ncbi:winged helix-turn-helix domain-containing protein [Aliikangiella sp. IMCC44359]|uniref:winged helix-turn-helix domain-containing protein n=1 Tax=Aliikangiella sp. IMCC44359 TaxID=3459125 RepID=UPI00403A9C01
MQKNKASCYQLNNKVITPDLNLIQCNEQDITITPRAMALLVYFLERPMQVISVQEIAENVWNSPYVTNTAIQRVIGLIRKALDDDKNKPRYIETIAKKGYRLIADVNHKIMESAPEETVNRGGIRTKIFIVFILLVLLIAVFFYFLFKPANSQIPHKVSAFSSLAGIESEPEFSPDSLFVVYTTKQKQNTNKKYSRIYVQAIDQATTYLLTKKEEHNYLPKWSNDGRYLISMRLSDNEHSKCQIVKIALDVTKTKNIEESNLFNCENFFITGLAWDSENNLLLFSAIDKRVSRKERVYQFNTATNQLTQLTSSPVEGKGDRVLDFDFESRKLLFFRDHFFSYDSLFSIDLNNLEIQKLYQYTDLINYARIDRKNQRLFFISKNNLYQYSLTNKVKALINNSVGYRSFDFSSDKNMMVVAHYRNVIDIYTRSFDSDDSLSPEKNFIESSSRDYMPSHIHGTNSVVFVSERSGKSQIWLKQQDNQLVQLTDEPFDFRNTTLKSNPQGNKVVFFARNGLHLLDVYSRKVTMIETGKTYSDFPNWSNDGKTIYFNGIINGEEQIWNIDLTSNLQRQITRHGGIMGAESPDGKGLYFTKSTSQGLWYLSFNDMKEVKVVENFPSILNSGLVMTEDGITYLQVKEGATLLKRVKIPSHEVVEIETLDNNRVFHLSVSPSSNKIYYAKNVKNDSDIILIR